VFNNDYKIKHDIHQLGRPVGHIMLRRYIIQFLVPVKCHGPSEVHALFDILQIYLQANVVATIKTSIYLCYYCTCVWLSFRVVLVF
jgi:hypothetical protein